MAHQPKHRNDLHLEHGYVLNLGWDTAVSYDHTAVWCLSTLRMQPASGLQNHILVNPNKKNLKWKQVDWIINLKLRPYSYISEYVSVGYTWLLSSFKENIWLHIGYMISCAIWSILYYFFFPLEGSSLSFLTCILQILIM